MPLSDMFKIVVNIKQHFLRRRIKDYILELRFSNKRLSDVIVNVGIALVPRLSSNEGLVLEPLEDVKPKDWV